MTFINRNTQAFNKNVREPIGLLRLEGQLKAYESAFDFRAWCGSVELRRQHILDASAYSSDEPCLDKLIPLDTLVEILAKDEIKKIKKFEQKVRHLRGTLKLYKKLKLNCDQIRQLKNLKDILDESFDLTHKMEGLATDEFKGSKGGARTEKTGPGTKDKGGNVRGSVDKNVQVTGDSSKKVGRPGTGKEKGQQAGGQNAQKTGASRGGAGGQDDECNTFLTECLQESQINCKCDPCQNPECIGNRTTTTDVSKREHLTGAGSTTSLEDQPTDTLGSEALKTVGSSGSYKSEQCTTDPLLSDTSEKQKSCKCDEDDFTDNCNPNCPYLLSKGGFNVSTETEKVTTDFATNTDNQDNMEGTQDVIKEAKIGTLGEGIPQKANAGIQMGTYDLCGPCKARVQKILKGEEKMTACLNCSKPDSCMPCESDKPMEGCSDCCKEISGDFVPDKCEPCGRVKRNRMTKTKCPICCKLRKPKQICYYCGLTSCPATVYPQ